MLAEGLQKIIDLAKPLVHKAEDGAEYWTKDGSKVEPGPDPSVKAVAKVCTLDALISALQAPECAGLCENSEIQIVVQDHRHVELTTPPDTKWATRDHYIDAVWSGDDFSFGRWMDQEEFTIKAQCLFVDTDMKRAMIAHVASIKAEEAVIQEDDGVSQSVTVQDSVGRAKHAEFSPMLTLRPYRTFPEAEQPESLFLLRIKKIDKVPHVALFEADGGLWKAQAAKNVARYIRESEVVQESGISVIG